MLCLLAFISTAAPLAPSSKIGKKISIICTTQMILVLALASTSNNNIINVG